MAIAPDGRRPRNHDGVSPVGVSADTDSARAEGATPPTRGQRRVQEPGVGTPTPGTHVIEQAIGEIRDHLGALHMLDCSALSLIEEELRWYQARDADAHQLALDATYVTRRENERLEGLRKHAEVAAQAALDNARLYARSLDEIERLRTERDMYMRSGRGEHDRLKRAEELEAENERLQAEVEELSARPDWTAYNALADERDENLEAAYYSVRDRLDEARADVRRLQADYERACKTIADLHVAGYVETEKAE
jgi:hypothetical protein